MQSISSKSEIIRDKSFSIPQKIERNTMVKWEISGRVGDSSCSGTSDWVKILCTRVTDIWISVCPLTSSFGYENIFSFPGWDASQLCMGTLALEWGYGMMCTACWYGMCMACWCEMMCTPCWCGMIMHSVLVWDDAQGMLVWHDVHGMMCMACWWESGPLLPSPPSLTLDPEMTLCKHHLSLPVNCREGRRSWGWDSRALGQAASPPASASCHPVLVWKLGQVLLLQGSPRKGPQGSNESWTKASYSSIQSPPARTAFYPVCPRFSLPSNCLPCVALAAIFFPLWCLPCQIFKGSYHVSLAKLHTFKVFSSFLINLGLTALNTYPYMLCSVCFGSGLGSTRIFLFRIIGTSVHFVSLLQTYSQGELGRHDSAHYGFKYSPGPFSPPRWYLFKIEFEAWAKVNND